IVHTHNSITGAVGRMAARLARVPVTIHTTHGFHFHEHMGPLKRLPFVTAERYLARRCDVLLCQDREAIADGHRHGLPPRAGAAPADVAVLTSVKEGIPRALMQAMAVGVPVVATDVKGNREVVLNGETGFLVPLGDVPALAERLRTLLASPELRRGMGARGVA